MFFSSLFSFHLLSSPNTQQMDYDKAIMTLLVEAGDKGLSVQKLSRHVYNACNTLFHPVSMSDVHQYVYNYLQRHTKGQHPMVCRTGQRGVYKLNSDNSECQQLLLQFTENTQY